MARYGYGYGRDMEADNPFYNPYMPGPDFASGVGNWYAILAGLNKEKEEKSRWEREFGLKEREVAAQEGRNAPKPEKPLFNITPQAVRDFAKELGYPDTALAGIEGWSQPALDKTWADLNDTYRTLTNQGLIQAGKKAPTKKGTTHATAMKSVIDILKQRRQTLGMAYQQLEANPMNAMIDPGRMEEIKKRLDGIDAALGEVASFQLNLDENGELLPEQYAKVTAYLKNPAAIEGGYATRPQTKGGPKPATPAPQILQRRKVGQGKNAGKTAYQIGPDQWILQEDYERTWGKK